LDSIKNPDNPSDPNGAIERLAAFKKNMGGEFPKILLLVNGCRDFALLKKTLEQIPVQVVDLIGEIAVFDHYPPAEIPEALRKIEAVPAYDKLRVCRTPRRYEYGDNLKNGFDYAVARGFDLVIVFRSDGLYDPARIPLLLHRALNENSPAVLGDRFKKAGLRENFSRASFRLRAGRLFARVEETMLRLGIEDYHCGYRLFSTTILRRVPYHLNASDYLFDLQLLIQIRSLGVQICGVQVPAFHDPAMGPLKTVTYALRALWTVWGYRLHQLHISRKGMYFVDQGETYTLKKNRYSSHMQIMDAIKPGSSILDLGCGQGILAEEYAGKGILTVGVDHIHPDKVSSHFENYIQKDLESELKLPYGRVFDYIVLSDVIEHIKNRDEMMRSLRRYLKEGGEVIISTGNIAIWFYRLSLLLGRFEYGPKGILDRTHVHLFTLNSFTRFIRQNGYRILDIKYTPIPFELVLSSTGRSRMVERITRWYQRLTSIWPRLFAYQFIIRCTFSYYESAEGEAIWKPD